MPATTPREAAECLTNAELRQAITHTATRCNDASCAICSAQISVLWERTDSHRIGHRERRLNLAILNNTGEENELHSESTEEVSQTTDSVVDGTTDPTSPGHEPEVAELPTMANQGDWYQRGSERQWLLEEELIPEGFELLYPGAGGIVAESSPDRASLDGTVPTTLDGELESGPAESGSGISPCQCESCTASLPEATDALPESGDSIQIGPQPDDRRTAKAKRLP